MDAAQVKEHFNAFLTAHPNGKMKPRSSERWSRRRCPRATRPRWRSTSSGSTTPTTTYIDFVEFMLIFHIMSDGTPEEVLEKIFRVFDVNSDGTINKKEMQRLIKDMYGLIKADDPEAESKDLIAKSAFAEMDKDADGKITCSEFTTACLSQEKISKMLALKVIDIFVEETEERQAVLFIIHLFFYFWYIIFVSSSILWCQYAWLE